MTPARPAVLTLFIAHVARVAWVYPTLPPIVASHFNGQGAADGWMSRESHATQSVALGALPLLFAFGVPLLVRSLPIEWINLPNKDRWLRGPEREASLQWLDQYFAWMGVGLMAFLAAVFVMVDDAQAQTHPSLPMVPFLGGLAAVVGGAFVSFGALNRRFPADVE